MEQINNRSTSLARLIIRVTNPPILSVITLVLIILTKSDNSLARFSGVMVILLFFVLLPVGYLYLRTFKGKLAKSEIEFTLFLKQHPKDILILALLLGPSSLVVLWTVGAPQILIYTIAALIAGSIITALINAFYRASFHLTGIIILSVLAAKAWGVGFLILLTVIPWIFWAKYYSHEHTIPQLLVGIAVAVTVLLIFLQVFWPK